MNVVNCSTVVGGEGGTEVPRRPLPKSHRLREPEEPPEERDPPLPPLLLEPPDEPPEDLDPDETDVERDPPLEPDEREPEEAEDDRDSLLGALYVDCGLSLPRLEERSTELFSDLDDEFEDLPVDDSVSAAGFSDDLLMTVHGAERVLTTRRTSLSVFPDASGDSMRVAVRSAPVRSFMRYSRSPLS